MKEVKEKACEAIISFETIQSDIKREIGNTLTEDVTAQNGGKIFEGINIMWNL